MIDSESPKDEKKAEEVNSWGEGLRFEPPTPDRWSIVHTRYGNLSSNDPRLQFIPRDTGIENTQSSVRKKCDQIQAFLP